MLGTKGNKEMYGGDTQDNIKKEREKIEIL
jgi:hypothetical protein